MWFSKRNSDRKPIQSSGPRLVADVEAFFDGDYVEHLRRQCDAVNGWAWLNRLAHADLNSLRRVRDSNKELVNWAESEWTSAQQILVLELLELVDDDQDLLSRIQKAVLVPLELRLIRSDATSNLTPLGLVQFTRSALRSNIP